MITKSLSEILPIIGAARNRVENWPSRLHLTSTFQQPENGLAREFSRANTLELALIAAFVKAGATASQAAAMAGAGLRQDRRGEVREYWLFVAGEMGVTQGTETDVITAKSLLPGLEKAWPPVMTIVRVGEIVRRIDGLFVDGPKNA